MGLYNHFQRGILMIFWVTGIRICSFTTVAILLSAGIALSNQGVALKCVGELEFSDSLLGALPTKDKIVMNVTIDQKIGHACYEAFAGQVQEFGGCSPMLESGSEFIIVSEAKQYNGTAVVEDSNIEISRITGRLSFEIKTTFPNRTFGKKTYALECNAVGDAKIERKF